MAKSSENVLLTICVLYAVILVERYPTQVQLIKYRMQNLATLPAPVRELQAPRLPLKLRGLAEVHYPFWVS